MTVKTLVDLMSDFGRVSVLGAVVGEVRDLTSTIQRWQNGVEGPRLKGGSPSKAYLSVSGMALLVARRDRLLKQARVMLESVHSLTIRTQIEQELEEISKCGV